MVLTVATGIMTLTTTVISPFTIGHYLVKGYRQSLIILNAFLFKHAEIRYWQIAFFFAKKNTK